MTVLNPLPLCVGGVGGAQMKITVRNLRLREDTPKYLRNLALDSAHYDPKARSMRCVCVCLLQ